MRKISRNRPAIPPTTPPAMAAVRLLLLLGAEFEGTDTVAPGGSVEVTWIVFVTATPLEVVMRTDWLTVTDWLWSIELDAGGGALLDGGLLAELGLL